jgi:hypothetical protein
MAVITVASRIVSSIASALRSDIVRRIRGASMVVVDYCKANLTGAQYIKMTKFDVCYW